MIDVEPLSIAGSRLLRGPVHRDERGCFYEVWREQNSTSAGLPDRFVQDNISISYRNVIRGLHLQYPRPQGKLIHVVCGQVWDVSVDLRRGSPTFGQWLGVMLAEADGCQIYLPPGVAHGFAVLSDRAAVSYKCTTYHEPGQELTVRWDDPTFAINWPVQDPTLSAKDRNALLLADIPAERLPVYGEGT